MALPTNYWVLELLYRTARYERMALSHAFSLHRYGSFQPPYDNAMEFGGDLAVQLLNRAYMFFAAHARNHFISTLYYYFHDYPNKDIILPLGHIRVPKAVNYAPATSVALTYSDPGGPHLFPRATPQAVVTAGTLSIGQTIVQVNATPFENVPGDNLEADYFANWPHWRVSAPPWSNSDSLKVGTQAATVMEVDPIVKCTVPVETFMARMLPPVQGRIIPDLTNQRYIADYEPIYDYANSTAKLNQFAALSDNLAIFPGAISNLTGGMLTLGALPTGAAGPKGSCVIAIVGEASFRPVFSLDVAEPQSPINDQNTIDPSSNRLSPFMLYPVPSYEQLTFLENFYIGVGQVAFLSHLSSDDDRYEAESQMLTQFVQGLSVQPTKDIRTKLLPPERSYGSAR